MSVIRHTALILGLSALAVFATTQHIPYTGGKQPGTATLRGTHGAGLPDTVVLDSALRVVAFTEESYAPNVGPTNYWLFLENSQGTVGFRNGSDTIWNESTRFPVTTLHLDSVVPVQDPLGRFWPANLDGKRYGLKARRVDRGLEGVPAAYSVDRVPGDNRAIYFRINKSQGVRYGKLMILRDSVHTMTQGVIDGDKQFISVTVNFVMFSAAELDTVPLALRPVRAAASLRNVRLTWSEREGLRLRDARGTLYDLHGKRVPVSAPARPKD